MHYRQLNQEPISVEFWFNQAKCIHEDFTSHKSTTGM